MKNFLLLSFICIYLNSYCQKNDSLFTIFNNNKLHDTIRLKAIQKIANRYRYSKPDTALVLYNKELNFAKKKRNKIYESKAYTYIGYIYEHQGHYQESLLQYFLALKVRKDMNDKRGIAGSYIDIGLIYEAQGNHPKSLEQYFLSLKIMEDINDKSGMAKCYTNIASIYLVQNDFKLSYKYYNNALKISEELHNKNDLYYCYKGLAIWNKKQGFYIDAIKYNTKAIEVVKSIGNNGYAAEIYNNIANIYSEQKNYQLALENYLLSLKIMEEIGRKNGVAMIYTNIGDTYNDLGKPIEATKWITKGLFLAKDVGDIDNERDAYKCLASSQEKLGNYKEAYEFQKKFQKLNDSIFNQENSKQLSELKTNFEVEKKEAELKAEQIKREIELRAEQSKKEAILLVEHKTRESLLKADQEKKELYLKNEQEKELTTIKLEQEKKNAITIEEKKKQRIILFAVTSFLLLVAVFSVFMYRRFKLTQKQKIIIEAKEQETQQQKHLIEEKHKEITDSINYAERIQRSFLASTKTLDENLKEYFVLFKPKDVVSGDFYWADTLANGNFILATADSTGHGVPGAIMSLLNITSLEKAAEQFTNPADVLNHTRQTIINRLKRDGSAEGGKDGMDCSLLVFDFANKQLQIAAANNPVWITRNNELIEIKPDKMPVGKSDRDTESFTLHTIELLTGDTIYTLTDGFPDQFGGPNSKKFMSKKLKELIIANFHLPITQQKELLDTTFKNWVGDLEQVDDVCIIGIRI